MSKSKLAIKVFRLLEKGIITDIQADNLAKKLERNEIAQVEKVIQKIIQKPRL